MSQTKVLGNPEKRKTINRLLREAGEDSLIKGVLEGREGDKTEYNLEFELLPCEMADEIIKKVEDRLHQLTIDECLVDDGIDKEPGNYDSGTNAALALIYYVKNEIAKGHFILEAIQNQIGFKKLRGVKLVKSSEWDNDLDLNVPANVFLNLDYWAYGIYDQDFKPIKSMEKYLNAIVEDEETGAKLVLTSIDTTKQCLFTDDNAALAFGYAYSVMKEDAVKLVNGIEERIGYDDLGSGFIHSSMLDRRWDIEDNALFALACFHTGKYETALRITEIIEGRFEGEHPLGDSYGTRSCVFSALAFMAKAYYEKFKPT